MLAYSLAHLANALLFGGLFAFSFSQGSDSSSSSTTTTEEESDGAVESVVGDESDNILSSIDPDGANFSAGDGDDSITGTDANDYLLAGTGNDTADMGAGDDRVLAKEGLDSIDGGAGNDELFGGGDADFLIGNTGDDALTGGTGNDQMFGGGGTDTLDGGEDDDVLSGGEGDDQLWGAQGDDQLFGGAGADVLNGASADTSTLADGSIDGVDSLYGGADDDFLTLGVGDIGEGGAGADTFNVDKAVTGAGTVQINDFNAVEDGLEIEYTAATDPNTGTPITPVVTVTNFDDGTGAFVALDGVNVASVVGAQDLDPSTISLIAA